MQLCCEFELSITDDYYYIMLCSSTFVATLPHSSNQYCIVLYLRLFSNMGDKTHPFTISLYDTLYIYAKSYE